MLAGMDSRRGSANINYQPRFRKKVVWDDTKLEGGQEGGNADTVSDSESVWNLSIETEPIRSLLANECLVRVHATPVHVEDIDTLAAGMRGDESTSGVMGGHIGCEGSGRVIARGPGGNLFSNIVGKRVAFLSRVESSWADYVIVLQSDLIVLEEDTPVEMASVAFSRPMLAQVMMTIAAVNHKSNALLNTAATTTVGRMLMQHAHEEGIETINIVRYRQEADEMRAVFPSLAVFSMDDPDLLSKIQAMCIRIGCTVAFDAHGGLNAGLLLKAMPPSSTVYVYGNLPLPNPPSYPVSGPGLIASGSQLRGLSLGRALDATSSLTLKNFKVKVRTRLYTQPPHEVRRFTIDETKEAIAAFASHDGMDKNQGAATGTHVLIMPDVLYQRGHAEPVPSPQFFPKPPAIAVPKYTPKPPSGPPPTANGVQDASTLITTTEETASGGSAGEMRSSGGDVESKDQSVTDGDGDVR